MSDCEWFQDWLKILVELRLGVSGYHYGSDLLSVS